MGDDAKILATSMRQSVWTLLMGGGVLGSETSRSKHLRIIVFASINSFFTFDAFLNISWKDTHTHSQAILIKTHNLFDDDYLGYL